MFGTLGGPELVLILVLALIVFGPRKLPEIGRSIGKVLAEFRKASNDFKRTIDDEIEAEKVRPDGEAPRLDPATPIETGPTEDVSAVPREPSPGEIRVAPPEGAVVSRETTPPREPE